MKIAKVLYIIVLIALLVWVFASFGEIAFRNPLEAPVEYSSWNIFARLF